jgi:hypothetical protein
MSMRQLVISLAAQSLVFGAGCKGIGPGTVPRDRFEYSKSMTESWKRQTLLNIARLRYYESPRWREGCRGFNRRDGRFGLAEQRYEERN